MLQRNRKNTKNNLYIAQLNTVRMSVIIYSTPLCPWCKKTKDYFKKHKIAFKDIDVSKNTKAAHTMMRLSGQTGVPVIVSNDAVIVGYNESRFKSLPHG